MDGFLYDNKKINAYSSRVYDNNASYIPHGWKTTTVSLYKSPIISHNSLHNPYMYETKQVQFYPLCPSVYTAGTSSYNTMTYSASVPINECLFVSALFTDYKFGDQVISSDQIIEWHNGIYKEGSVIKNRVSIRSGYVDIKIPGEQVVISTSREQPRIDHFIFVRNSGYSPIKVRIFNNNDNKTVVYIDYLRMYKNSDEYLMRPGKYSATFKNVVYESGKKSNTDVTFSIVISCVSYSHEGIQILSGITDEDYIKFQADEASFIFRDNLVIEDIDVDYNFCFGT